MANRGILIAYSNLSDDKITLMYAKAMQRVYPDLRLIGFYPTESLNKKAIEKQIEGFKCILFPEYSNALTNSSDQNTSDKITNPHEYNIEEVVRNISTYTEIFDPNCVHTMDAEVLPIGRRIKSNMEQADKQLVWYHYFQSTIRNNNFYDEKAVDLKNLFLNRHLPFVDHLIVPSENCLRTFKSRYDLVPDVSVIIPSVNACQNLFSLDKTVRFSLNLVNGEKLAVILNDTIDIEITGIVRTFLNSENYHLAICSSVQDEILGQLKDEIGDSDRIHFCGPVQDEKLGQFLSDADVAIHISDQEEFDESAASRKFIACAFFGIPVCTEETIVKSATIANDVLIGGIKQQSVNRLEEIFNAASAKKQEFDKNQSRKIEELKLKYSWEVQEKKLLELYLHNRGYEGAFVPTRLTPPESSSEKLNVLQGLTGAAGQPGALSAALNKFEGVFAQSLQVTLSKFGYDLDLAFPILKTDPQNMSEVFASVANSFDIFHLHTRGFVYDRFDTDFPTGVDLLALKAAGKTVIVHFRGSEARLQSEFMKMSPYNYIEDDEEGTIDKFPEHAKRQYISMVTDIADVVLVNDAEIQSYVPGSQIVERSIDLSEWKNVGVKRRTNPVVVHAPSRRGVKGTQHVFDAVERLKREGVEFEFRLVENMTHDEARAVYEDADIIVDQLRIGWYGVLSVEAMALGKPVMAYIRADLEHHLGENPPLVNANPDTIYEKLKELILNPDMREEMSVRARKYCEATHDTRRVAEKLLGIYREARNNPRQIDPVVVMDHIMRQKNAIDRANEAKSAKLNKLARSNKTLTQKLNAELSLRNGVVNALAQLKKMNDAEFHQNQKEYFKAKLGFIAQAQKLSTITNVQKYSVVDRLRFVKRTLRDKGFVNSMAYFGKRLIGKR